MGIVNLEQAKEIADNSAVSNYLKLEDDGDKAHIVFLVKKPNEFAKSPNDDNGTDYILSEESYFDEATKRGEPYTKEHRAQGK
jgi:hypothetical protein